MARFEGILNHCPSARSTGNILKVYTYILNTLKWSYRNRGIVSCVSQPTPFNLWTAVTKLLPDLLYNAVKGADSISSADIAD